MIQQFVEEAMRVRRTFCWFICLCAATLTLGSSAKSPENQLRVVSHTKLCVTEGAIEGLQGEAFQVSAPKMRAYLNEYTPPVVEETFTYLGGTQSEATLGSGEVRRQFGLKLRAQDACNLVYAMWRTEPESKLVVSVKSNPGEHTSPQCGNRGYHNIRPRVSAKLPSLQPGDVHTLRAEMHGLEIRVLVDSSMVWFGTVGTEALVFDGPIGIRTDNVRLQIELRAARPTEPQSEHLPGCRSAPEEND